jgi:hypothetical protein
MDTPKPIQSLRAFAADVRSHKPVRTSVVLVCRARGVPTVIRSVYVMALR